MPVEVRIRGPDNSAEIAERFLVHLVIFEELRVIAKISEKPIEFLEGSLRAIQPPVPAQMVHATPSLIG